MKGREGKEEGGRGGGGGGKGGGEGEGRGGGGERSGTNERGMWRVVGEGEGEKGEREEEEGREGYEEGKRVSKEEGMPLERLKIVGATLTGSGAAGLRHA